MANTQINVTANGTTTLATAGKYCDRNIDVNVNVSNKPTQFTNYYDPANVTVDERVSYSSSSGLTRTSDTESNVLRVPYHKTAGTPFVVRMRGISTVRSRLIFVCFNEDGSVNTSAYGSFTQYIDMSYDEYGDVVLTGKGTPFTSKEWYFIEFNIQYTGLSSAETALTGPIVTINEPIGNGSTVGEEFEGDYEVTPKVEAQTLQTRNKLMKADVSIKEIPFFDVSNTSGGSTVYIGTLPDTEVE